MESCRNDNGFLGFCCRHEDSDVKRGVVFRVFTGEGPDHTNVQL